MHSTVKHLLHCASLCMSVSLVVYVWDFFNSIKTAEVISIERNGVVFTILCWMCKCLPLLLLPQCVFQLVGLTFYNAFKEKVPLKAVPLLAPFVCFRVVTRGLFPRMVKNNLSINIDVCNKARIKKFMFEVVTDKRIELSSMPMVREIVVPESYSLALLWSKMYYPRTNCGALFKARALQYCIEENVNRLQDSDWVVHLDEETLLTTNAVSGILNFIETGHHDFGQGVIMYASGEIVNWLNTLCDAYRVADDYGKLRCQLALFHKPLFGWKGSYVVARNGAERTITWDHGPEGSIAEDAYFGLLAMQEGYSFDFIEGEMLEKSPFTTMDYLKQRKRWLEGLILTVHSKKIHLTSKLALASSIYSWFLPPFIIAYHFMILIGLISPLPYCPILDSILISIQAVYIYMVVFGAVRSFSQKYRNNKVSLIFCCIGACLTIPYAIFIQVASIFLLFLGPKKEFYIVNKDRSKLILL